MVKDWDNPTEEEIANNVPPKLHPWEKAYNEWCFNPEVREEQDRIRRANAGKTMAEMYPDPVRVESVMEFARFAQKEPVIRAISKGIVERRGLEILMDRREKQIITRFLAWYMVQRNIHALPESFRRAFPLVGIIELGEISSLNEPEAEEYLLQSPFVVR